MPKHEAGQRVAPCFSLFSLSKTGGTTLPRLNIGMSFPVANREENLI